MSIYKLAVLLSCIVVTGYACQYPKNNKVMNNQELNPQQNDTGRLLTVANLQQPDSNKKVTAWFFETPQIFEFSMDSANGQTMFNLLQEAKEKAWPVNVFSSSHNTKNNINQVTPATEAQLTRYKEEKNSRELPTRVQPPQN